MSYKPSPNPALSGDRTQPGLLVPQPCLPQDTPPLSQSSFRSQKDLIKIIKETHQAAEKQLKGPSRVTHSRQWLPVKGHLSLPHAGAGALQLWGPWSQATLKACTLFGPAAPDPAGGFRDSQGLSGKGGNRVLLSSSSPDGVRDEEGTPSSSASTIFPLQPIPRLQEPTSKAAASPGRSAWTAATSRSTINRGMEVTQPLAL